MDRCHWVDGVLEWQQGQHLCILHSSCSLLDYDLEILYVEQARDFSRFFRISGFFRAQKILKSIEIMQSFHILNKDVVKIVPWS